ncbi:MAG TPA: toprim domain-containing protein [Candidatus Bathyarchaeia archaeon]|nr:toprim domain-containing protein [Candidatus Bathyarchaeia archaeon]
MLKRLQEKEEGITQILNALAEESAKGTLILVEGKKDVEALRTLGIEGSMQTVKTGGRSFVDVVSELEESKAPKVILLLDFDRRGKEGTRRLKQNLERAKIKTEIEFWRALSRLAGRDVQCVEGLVAYMENLRTKAGNER